MRKIALLLAAATILAGCTSPKTAKNAASDEYVDYIPTGSKIPIKVKKSDLQTSATTTANSQDMVREVQTQGAMHPPH